MLQYSVYVIYNNRIPTNVDQGVYEGAPVVIYNNRIPTNVDKIL